MAASLTSLWLNFFREAGINNTTSTALYATTFAENEIQEDMVGDLNRDILREMGITVMGHVLAILKHAKAVHNRAENEKIVAKAKPVTVATPSRTIDSPKKSTPATRTIERYVRPSEPESPSPPPAVKKQVVPSAPAVDRIGSRPPQLKVTDRLGILKKKAKQVISLRQELVEEVPVKRVRRVLPEQEGGYKITMPTGSTPRTKQILAQQTRTSHTVFDRLGDGSVSSTTEPEDSKVGGSVFARLGGRTEISSTTAKPPFPPGDQVGYHGVLKKSTTVFTRTIGEAKSSAGILGNPVGSIKPSAKSRLGQSEQSSTDAATTSRPVTTRKKFVLVKKSGAREIVYRDVPTTTSKCVTFDAATRSKFRSDNIAVVTNCVTSVTDRLGGEEKEWDY